jgi:Family of unknown function (DUF5719)
MKLPIRILGLTLTLAGLAGAGFMQGFQLLVPEPSAQEPISVTTDAKPLQLYCPGPLVELGGKDGTDLGSIALVGRANLSYRLGAGSLTEDPDSKIESGSAITMASREQGSDALAALQTQLIQRPRMAGLAATNCGQPLAEGWLLTGLAGTGFESILLVANPNPVEVQIALTFHLETTTTSHLITLAPFAQQQLSLASFVEAEPQFAIHFQSSGQKVSVALQNRSSAGLSATGVELVGPTAKPAKSLVIPGFEILADGLAEPSLRVFNPGAEPTTALITFVGTGTNSDVVQVSVPAGGFELVQPKLADGNYLVLIEAEAEVLAALYNPYVGKNFDFGWLSPATAMNGKTAMAIPGYSAKLAIANPSDQPVNVILALDSGAQALSIPARSQVLVNVSGRELVMESAAAYRASLILNDPKGYSVVSPSQNANLGSDIKVAVR